MPYLVASTFAAILPGNAGTITASSTPLTLSEVATIIERISVEIDGAAAVGGYAVPINASLATAAYSQVQNITEEGAAWKTLRTIFPDQGGPQDKSSLAAEYRDAYLMHLDQLRKGELLLVGAGELTDDTSVVLPRSFSTSQGNAGTAGASALVPILWEP